MTRSDQIAQIDGGRCCQEKPLQQGAGSVVVEEPDGFSTANVLVSGTTAYMTVVGYNNETKFTEARTVQLNHEKAEILGDALHAAARQMRAASNQPPRPPVQQARTPQEQTPR